MPEMRKSAKPTLDTRYTVQLGSQIRELRKARDWTQKHLASLVRVSEGQISKYEAGANSPPPLTLARLARAFGLPVDAVLPEVSDAPLASPAEASRTAPFRLPWGRREEP
jgi:putative transcriptional regulator